MTAGLVDNEKISVFARDRLHPVDPFSMKVSPLGGRGSERSFYRVTWDNGASAILIHYNPVRIENSYYADLAGFLASIGVPVPKVFGHDKERCLMVVEDLGEDDLWSLRSAPWEVRKDLYRKTLTIIHSLHSYPEDSLPGTGVTLMEPFGPDLYRWERTYFMDNFVKRACEITLEDSFVRALAEELSALAGRLGRGPRSLLHRDLQSQNVMAREGAVFLIDFQGMRLGNPFYDLGSLLCDPYVAFSDEERQELLSFYYGLAGRPYDFAAFQVYFWEASAQRLMQAVGAYGYLGLVKGLSSFIGHIPAGLKNLCRAASMVPALRKLQGLAELCLWTIESKGLPL